MLKLFRGRFIGKSSPSHFWWGAFDLSCTRFSGAVAPPHPGGIPNLRRSRDARGLLTRLHQRRLVARQRRAHRSRSPRSTPIRIPNRPAAPTAAIAPAAARWDTTLHEWVLPYDAVRTAADPDAMLLEFLQSTYETAARLAGWDRRALERPGG